MLWLFWTLFKPATPSGVSPWRLPFQSVSTPRQPQGRQRHRLMAWHNTLRLFATKFSDATSQASDVQRVTAKPEINGNKQPQRSIAGRMHYRGEGRRRREDMVSAPKQKMAGPAWRPTLSDSRHRACRLSPVLLRTQACDLTPTAHQTCEKSCSPSIGSANSFQ